MIILMVAPMVVSDISDRIPILGAVLFGFLGGLYLQIVWFVASFFLWVILTVWCCLVIHGDQRREEIEQLINTIKVDSGKSLHQETQQANKTKKMWYLAITFLIGLAILAVLFIKREHQPSNNPNNSPKSGVKKLKNPSHKKPQELKNSNNRSN